MSKRTERVISSVAAFIAFVFVASAGVNASEARQERQTDFRFVSRAGNFRTNFGKDFRIERPDVRERDRQRESFDRSVDFAARLRARDGGSFRADAFLARDRQFDRDFDRQFDRQFSRQFDRQFDRDFDIDSRSFFAERRPDAERELRVKGRASFAGRFDFDRERDARAV